MSLKIALANSPLIEKEDILEFVLEHFDNNSNLALSASVITAVGGVVKEYYGITQSEITKFF